MNKDPNNQIENRRTTGVETGQLSKESLGKDELIRGLVINKQGAYRLKFGNDYETEDCYFLPVFYCQAELEKAKTILSEQGMVCEAKLTPYEEYQDSIGGLEINVGGRRFALPRDQFLILEDSYVFLEVDNAVVSVLDKKNWPADLPFKMTPKTIAALDDIANGSLVNEIRDLAIYLQLGDRQRKRNVSYANVVGIEASWIDINAILGRFGVDNVDELRTILSSIGLEIINTADRLIDNVSPSQIRSGQNSATEVDSLLESINRSQNKRLTKKRWLHGTL